MYRLHDGTLWIGDERPAPRVPWLLRGALVLGLIVWLFAVIGARSLFSQVTATAYLSKDRIAEVSVGPVATPQRVSIVIYRNDSTKVLGDTVRALVSPRQFTLLPGTIQLVRVRIDATVQPGEVLRVATLFVPVDSTTGQTIALEVAIRLVTKMIASSP